MRASLSRPSVGEYRALGYIAVTAVLVMLAFVAVLAVVGELGTYMPTPVWTVAWFSLAFYVSWWVVYLGFSREPEETGVEPDDEAFAPPDHSIVTLRTFLKYYTPRGRVSATGESLAEKAGATIQAVGVIVGFSLLVFSITVQTLFDGSPSTVDTNILSGVLALQVFAIASFLISIDSLDSTLNEFVFARTSRIYRHRKYFYDRGIVCYYRGLVALVLSMFLLTMIVQPLVTVFGVFIFSVYGYYHWFGYEAIDA